MKLAPPSYPCLLKQNELELEMETLSGACLTFIAEAGAILSSGLTCLSVD